VRTNREIKYKPTNFGLSRHKQDFLPEIDYSIYFAALLQPTMATWCFHFDLLEAFVERKVVPH
jgi:hypothetical protein